MRRPEHSRSIQIWGTRYQSALVLGFLVSVSTNSRVLSISQQPISGYAVSVSKVLGYKVSVSIDSRVLGISQHQSASVSKASSQSEGWNNKRI